MFFCLLLCVSCECMTTPYTILKHYKDDQRVKELDDRCKVRFNFQWMVTYEDRLGVQKTILVGSSQA